jgi:hypothetical protein
MYTTILPACLPVIALMWNVRAVIKILKPPVLEMGCYISVYHNRTAGMVCFSIMLEQNEV